MRYCIIKTGSGRSLLCSLCCTRGFVMGWCRKIGNACMYDDNANYWLWWPQRKCSIFLILVTGKWGVLALLIFFLSSCCPLRRMPWHGVFPVCSGGGWCVYGMIFSMGPLVWHRVSTLVLGGDQQSARLLVISAEVPYLFQSYLWIDCHRIDCDGSSEISEEPMAYDQTSFDTSIRSEICFF